MSSSWHDLEEDFCLFRLPCFRCCCGDGCGLAHASDPGGLGVLLGLAHVQTAPSPSAIYADESFRDEEGAGGP